MSEFLDMWEDSVVTNEDINSAKSEGLLESNWYQGQITEIAGRIVDQADSILFGKTLAHCTVDLYMVDGKIRKFWFDAIPDQIRSVKTGRLTAASKNGTHLASATGTAGQSFKSTMTQATQMRLEFKITLDKKNAKNWLNEIRRAA